MDFSQNIGEAPFNAGTTQIFDVKAYGAKGNGMSDETDAFVKAIKAAKDAGIACQRSVCPSSTGTNATTVNLTGKGVPTVDVGLPLYSMHTYNEVLSLFDANELARLIEVFVCDTEIAEVFAE